MTSTGISQGLEDDSRKTTKVLKPPGGDSSDIFGTAPEETSPRRTKQRNQSQLGWALFGDDCNNTGGNGNNSGAKTPRGNNKPDGNPVTGTDHINEPQNNGLAVHNGTSSSNSSVGDKSNDSSPAAKGPARTRVPPGGYSSKLW